jgi:hypothetical protein
MLPWETIAVMSSYFHRALRCYRETDPRWIVILLSVICDIICHPPIVSRLSGRPQTLGGSGQEYTGFENDDARPRMRCRVC